MKHSGIIKGCAVVLLAAGILTAGFSVASYAAGSDPLVTLGYLTEVLLPQWKKDIAAETTRIVDEKLSGSSSSEQTVTVPDVAPSSASYTLLELTEGQKLYAVSALEIVLRPGSAAVVYSPYPEQGIGDLTHGTEHLSGATLPVNSYLLIPRGGDGRCITVTNQTSYVLVRGEYSIG